MVRIYFLLLAIVASLACFNTALAEEGRVVRSIHITGLERTEPVTVLRQLPFTEGDVWQDKWGPLSERWLRNLGIFSDVHVSPPDEEGKVEILVNERWALWLLPEVSRKDNGASSWGLSYDDYNMWGLNHHLAFSVKQDKGKNFTANNGESYSTSYLWRRVADSKLSVSVSYGWGRSRFDTYQNGAFAAQYSKDSKAGSVVFSYALGPVPGEGWGVDLGYTGSNSSYTLVTGAPQPDLLSGKRRAVIAGIHYAQVDNQIVWFTGTAFDYSVSLAHKSIGSDITAYRQNISLRSYMPVWGQSTLNFRLNGGLVTGNVLRDGLFDLGNKNGIRGYFPGELQASEYIYGTVEGRFLIAPDSNVQLVAFSDVGHLRNRGVLPFGKPVIVGAGGGLRWTLRWLVHGTIRGDVAYGLASRKWRAYLGTQQAF